MKILAISTSSSVCSVSILDDCEVINELNIKDTKTHSEKLMLLIDKALNDSNIGLSDIDLIACDNGPGSFTGIRIGIATIKALAEVQNLPVISVSSLEALSYNNKSEKEFICSIIDAKNNQVYCGIFNNKHQLVEDYMANDINEIMKTINKYNNIIFIGDGAVVHKELLDNKNICNDIEIHSKNVGLCAFDKYKQGLKETADSILPMYLRKSQAERMKKKSE